MLLWIFVTVVTHTFDKHGVLNFNPNKQKNQRELQLSNLFFCLQFTNRLISFQFVFSDTLFICFVLFLFSCRMSISWNVKFEYRQIFGCVLFHLRVWTLLTSLKSMFWNWISLKQTSILIFFIFRKMSKEFYSLTGIYWMK